VSDLADLDRIFAQIRAGAGRIDMLATNAGSYEFAKFGEITEEHYDKIYGTNVRGLLFAAASREA
jgi:NAD(P)-dependent dehydrogenase (short-subunit alcohol dehydrogenase family)